MRSPQRIENLQSTALWVIPIGLELLRTYDEFE